MIELQRQKYLKAMGVEHYYARFDLPGAKPSSIVPLQKPEHSSSAEVGLSPQSPGSSVDLGELTSTLTDNPGVSRKTSPQVQSESTASSKAPNSTAESVSFSLLVVSTNVDLLVVDDLGTADNHEQSLQLIQNILLAMGLDARCHFQHVTWPINQGGLLDSSEETARQMLQGVINRHEAKHLLLLGADAKRYIGQPSWQMGEIVSLSNQTELALYTYSAQEMLLDASLKPIVWNHLQPLKEKLTGS